MYDFSHLTGGQILSILNIGGNGMRGCYLTQWVSEITDKWDKVSVEFSRRALLRYPELAAAAIKEYPSAGRGYLTLDTAANKPVRRWADTWETDAKQNDHGAFIGMNKASPLQRCLCVPLNGTILAKAVLAFENESAYKAEHKLVEMAIERLEVQRSQEAALKKLADEVFPMAQQPAPPTPQAPPVPPAPPAPRPPLPPEAYSTMQIETDSNGIRRAVPQPLQITQPSIKDYNMNHSHTMNTLQPAFRIVNIQIIDNTPDMLPEHRLVAVIKDVQTDGTDQQTIMQAFTDYPISEYMAAHNAKRAKLVDEGILTRTGNTVMMRPIKLRDLETRVVPA